MARFDVAIVSLATTMGWRVADEALARQIEAAGASCELRTLRLGVSRHLQRGIAAVDAVQALAARRAARGVDARATIYSSVTAALLQPSRQPHAVRFDAIAALNRPGPSGLWQRRRERTVLAAADLLLPWSEPAAEAAHAVTAGASPPTIVVPCVVPEPSPPTPDAPDATAYVADPDKRRLGVLCDAWRLGAPDGARLVVGGIEREQALPWLARRGIPDPPPGVTFAGALPRPRWTALVSGSRAYLSAARYEDWGIAQMEALAAGTPLVTVPSAGPNVALPLARQLAPELVATDDGALALGRALATALELDEDARREYAALARELLEPYSEDAVQRIVAERLLPALLG